MLLLDCARFAAGQGIKEGKKTKAYGETAISTR